MFYQNQLNAAQAEVLNLLDAGWDWPDAQFHASEKFGVDADDLQSWYDQDDELEAAGERREYLNGHYN